MLRFYNSLTSQLELFSPLDSKRIGLYVCGPTVYDSPHLGNARAMVIFDLVYRVLRFTYGPEAVYYVRNITDVDDKILNRARELDIPPFTLTAQVIAEFNDVMDALNCLAPNTEPKVTDHLAEIITMIEKLIANGYAYVAEGHVYFAASKYHNYLSKLTGLSLEELIPGARIEVNDSKHSPYDFVLWKPVHDQHEEGYAFDSPWGRGRPGWHIECSAMSTKYLGQDFDIHGGGADLKFPHHNNEIAQSCGAYPGSHYAKYWLHNGFVTVDGEKMSKSLGNFLTVKEQLAAGIKGEVIRYALLSTHYRKPFDWTSENVEQAQKTLDYFYRAIEDYQLAKELAVEKIELDQEGLKFLCDDFNTPGLIARMNALANEINKLPLQNKERSALQQKLYYLGNLFGIFKLSVQEWFQGDLQNAEIDISYIEQMISKRQQAKASKDWALADAIRKELTEKGIILEDKATGTTWRRSV